MRRRRRACTVEGRKAVRKAGREAYLSVSPVQSSPSSSPRSSFEIDCWDMYWCCAGISFSRWVESLRVSLLPVITGMVMVSMMSSMIVG